MSDIQTLRSYLVDLGFSVNNPQFAQFNAALELASKKTKGTVAGIATDVLKWQATLAGFFISTGAAIVATMDRVAQADLKFKLMGERMMMTTSRARAFGMSIDALGGNMGAIAFDPELHKRFNSLMSDQETMGKGLGMDFESNMQRIRDVRFEFTRLKFELQYGVMGIVNEIFKGLGLGSGDFAKRLRDINDYIIRNLPRWSKIIANDIVPFLKDVWMIAKDIWEIMKDLATVFDNFVGILSGDKSIQGAANMEKFAKSVQKVTHWMALALHYSLKLFGLFAGSSIGGAVGGAIGLATGGPAGALAGAEIGTLAGGTIGNLAHIAGHLMNGGATGASGASGGGSGASAMALSARQAAAMVGAKLGIDPAIIYAQWAHETGNFTNRGATQLNNFAGINVPGGHGQDYRSFSSVGDFANYYTGLIQRRYSSAIGSQTPEAFASALKAGGYYGDSLRNYSSGLRSHMGDYSKGNVTNQINVNVKTNANPNEIAMAVANRLDQQQARDRQRVLVQFSPAYQ